MGCAGSKVDNEEGVARCRARKRFMKHAVTSRDALAFAHAQYLQALKGSGAAFRQFADGEFQELPASEPPSTALVAIAEAPPLPLPPPPPLFPIMPPSPPRSSSLQVFDPDHTALDTAMGSPPSKDRQVAYIPPRPRSPEAFTDRSEDQSSFYQLPPPPPPFYSSHSTPPPPAPRSSWHNLFLDPFHPVPEIEFPPPSPPPVYFIEPTKIKHSREAESEQKKLKEEGMPDLEDVEPETNGVHESKRKVQLVKSEKLPAKRDTEQRDTKKRDTKTETAIVERNMEMSITETAPNQELTVAVSLKGKDLGLLGVLREVDDLFQKAAESGDPVSQILETKKVHYHSSFSEVKGIADQSAKVFNSSFWSRSLSRSSSSSSQRDLIVDTVGENGGTMSSHATILDRLFAWEKKLFDEVKSAEVIRIDLEKKCSLLRNQDAKGEDPIAIDKTRAAIKVVHARFVVALQAVEAASNAVHKLRDEELYQRLLELLEGMRDMWKEMYATHEAQHRIVEEMKAVKFSPALESTTSLHRQSTAQLATALAKWVQSFSGVIATQREYLKNLNGWLRVSLMQPDSELRNEQSKQRNGSSTEVAATPIYSLCQDWHRALDKLPDKATLDSINGFVDVVNEWVRLQAEELKYRKVAESHEKELNKKEQFLEQLERKYSDSVPAIEYEYPLDSPRRASLNENKGRVDQYRLKVEQEKEAAEKSVHATRVRTLNSIQHSLPGVFNSMTSFASVAYQTYSGLSANVANSRLPRLTG